MSFRWQMISLATACALAFILIYTQPDEPVVAHAETENPAVQSKKAAELEAIRATQFVAHEKQVRERQEQLQKNETDLAARAHAASRMIASRQMFQLAKGAAWVQVITTNQPLYKALRELAANSPGGVTPCTICDGNSYLKSCVMCEHNDGKCPSCKGSGRTAHNAYCPVCVGSGKCFVCPGTGRMLCPFCDDGMIDLRRAPPATTIPIE